MTTPQDEALRSFDDDKSLERTHANMAASGHAVEDKVEYDFFGFASEERWYFPGQDKLPADERQYFIVSKMNEGKKAEYQSKTTNDVRIQRTTGDARFRMDPSTERHTLINLSVTGARVKVRGKNTGELEWHSGDHRQLLKKWLDNGNPDHVQKLEKFIRELNPWMASEMEVEEIDKEIERLEELKKERREAEAGN